MATRTANATCPSASTRLTPERELDLVTLAQANHMVAMERLLEVHQPCIRRVAYNFPCPSRDRDALREDLHQEGCIRFCLVAVPRYQAGHGVRLWTYAHQVVWTAIRDACARWNYVPTNLATKQVLQARDQLAQLLERPPTAEEIAEWADLPLNTVQAVSRMGQVEEPLPEPGADQENAEGTSYGEIEDKRSPVDDALIVRDLYHTIINLLGDEAGVKWVTLFVLLESGGYKWEEIMTFLYDPVAGHTKWSALYATQPLPAHIPTGWAAICHLFHTSPPPLNDNLRFWYVRKRTQLKEQLQAAAK